MHLVDIQYQLGSKVSTNDEVEALYNLKNGFILEKTGVKERRYFDTQEDPTQIAADVAKKMLSEQDISLDQITAVYGSSNFYGPQPIPSNTHVIVQKIGLTDIPIRSTNYGCAGYLGAFEDMMNFIHTAKEKVYCLFILSDHVSSMCNTYNTAVLFSDAVCVSLWTNDEKYKERGAVDSVSFSNLMSSMDGVKLENGFWVMDGGKISRFVEQVPALIEQKMDLKLNDFKIITHQANPKLLETLEKKYDIELYKDDCTSFGNTSVPALFIAISNNLKKYKGDKDFLCIAFGDTGSYGGFILKRPR